MSKFFITGLPRSRTAWFAALCNTIAEDVVCYHEPVKYMKKWQDVYNIWEHKSTRSVGVSDHGLGFHITDIMKKAAPRTLIVFRPLEDVEQSLRQHDIHTPGYCALLQERLMSVHPSSNNLIMTVSYEALNTIDVVCECINHLLPNHTIHINKISAMMEFNIQASIDATKTLAQTRLNDLAALIGQDVLDELRHRRG